MIEISLIIGTFICVIGVVIDAFESEDRLSQAVKDGN